jgi:1-aminocyclopropane-1-carboxylate deaminase
LKATLTLDPITIDPLTSLSSSTVEASMLRLDKLHPIVSGNKWFKLRYYIEEAISQSCALLPVLEGPILII